MKVIQYDILRERFLNDGLVLHINGAWGSGKTTIGIKLKKKYKQKITLVDLDSITFEYIKKRYVMKLDNEFYRKFEIYINNLINKNRKKRKILVIAGVNNYNGQIYGMMFNHTYPIKADIKFFIKIDTHILITQLLDRSITNLYKTRKKIMHRYKYNKKDTIEKLNYAVNVSNWEKRADALTNKCKNSNYIFIRSDDIMSVIHKIISNPPNTAHAAP